MSGAEVTKNMEDRTKQRYITLKNNLSSNFIAENVNDNLRVFRNTCAGYLQGPGQYMNLHFYEICTNLESRSKLSFKNLTVLKEIVGQLPVSSDTMVELVNAAESEINAILSEVTKKMEDRAKQRYITLKNNLSNNFIAENVNDNLRVFRETCAGYFQGPAQYMNLHFYEICTNLESRSKLSFKNLTVLEEIVRQLPVSSDTMVELVNAAESEINAILSGRI